MIHIFCEVFEHFADKSKWNSGIYDKSTQRLNWYWVLLVLYSSVQSFELLFLLSVEECEDFRRKFKSGIFKCLNDNVGGT